jgi:2-polyprenyl-3-methyl-5-hydroxy-6-metoxy-1,4-benzoquinol methylase
LTEAPARRRALGRVERARVRFRRAPSAAEVAEAFELRGRTARCAELVELAEREVLNIGCSFGWFEQIGLERGAQRIVGLDASPQSLEAARERVPKAEFVLASAYELPFPDETFDVVTCFDVLEHLPKGKELTMLREMRRVLRGDGLIALSTPNRHWLATYADPAFYFGHRHYRADQVTKMVRQAGFEVKSLQLAGGIFDQLDLLFYYTWRHLFGRERHPFEIVRRRADGEWQRLGHNELLVVATPGLTQPSLGSPA